jgi:hypothetical protein
MYPSSALCSRALHDLGDSRCVIHCSHHRDKALREPDLAAIETVAHAKGLERRAIEGEESIGRHACFRPGYGNPIAELYDLTLWQASSHSVGRRRKAGKPAYCFATVGHCACLRNISSHWCAA